jgi:uncharacterized membrane protein YdjX (TVP38/TMEM64 family)
MTFINDAKEHLTRRDSQIHWAKLLIALAGLIAISFGFAQLFKLFNLYLINRNIAIYDFQLLTYILVFFVSLLANLTIVAPVPFAIGFMVGVAEQPQFNPILVALCGAIGGCLGEMSGYYAGRLGKKLAIADNLGYKKVEGWINKYGFWAITLLAIQPVIPFDLGGFIAGLAKMPVHKFLPALFIGKFPKYIVLVYAGIGLINFLPDWMSFK